MANAQNQTVDPKASAPPEWQQRRVAALQGLFPEAFSEGKVDLEKLQAALGEDVETRPERYSFTWAGKRDATLLLQVPSRATLVPAPDESVNFEATANIFIEGENLEVLKLLYKSYFGRVKMIYIDPPYNTGNDFIYPDNYTDPLDTYLKLTGQKDGNGNLLTSNPETSGRYHSSWLSMMYPRLFLARQLLHEDGVIFVSIDDHEVHNLRMLINEIFGEENFVAQLVWKSRQNKDDRAVNGVSTDHEYVLCYGKRLRGDPRKLEQYSNPDYDPRGDWASGNMVGLASEEQRPNLHYELIDPKTGINYGKPKQGWRYDKSTMARLIAEDRVLWPSSLSGRPRRKSFLSELHDQFTSYSSVIGTGIFTRDGTAAIESLFAARVMDFTKPPQLIRELLIQGCQQDGLVLDFFAGSCSTAQAILELNREDGGNRRFIMVQLPEHTPEGSAADKAGLKTIADIGKERIRRIIAKMLKENDGKLPTERETPEDLGFRVFKLAASNYRSWAGVAESTPQAYGDQIALYADPLVEGWTAENVMYEVAIREGYGLNCSIEKVHGIEGNTVYRVTDPDKGQWFHICLDDSLQPTTLKALELTRDQLFICRDKALNDEASANLALQCRLKTI
jgi:adenine-specific DNA-methyltransferase